MGDLNNRMGSVKQHCPGRGDIAAEVAQEEGRSP